MMEISYRSIGVQALLKCYFYCKAHNPIPGTDRRRFPCKKKDSPNRKQNACSWISRKVFFLVVTVRSIVWFPSRSQQPGSCVAFVSCRFEEIVISPNTPTQAPKETPWERFVCFNFRLVLASIWWDCFSTFLIRSILGVVTLWDYKVYAGICSLIKFTIYIFSNMSNQLDHNFN